MGVFRIFNRIMRSSRYSRSPENTLWCTTRRIPKRILHPGRPTFYRPLFPSSGANDVTGSIWFDDPWHKKRPKLLSKHHQSRAASNKSARIDLGAGRVWGTTKSGGYSARFWRNWRLKKFRRIGRGQWDRDSPIVTVWSRFGAEINKFLQKNCEGYNYGWEKDVSDAASE